MIAQYLKRLITEQADRAQSLARAIPDRQTHVVLENLAARYRSRLALQSQMLASAAVALDGAGKEGAVAALRILKICAREVGAIEGYGMPPLHCQSEAGRFLNHVLFMIHREVGLQFPCPAVSCTSNEHYTAHVYTNTIYVPLSEAEFLLHMPDFYHELGHYLYDDAVLARSPPLTSGVCKATEIIDRHYDGIQDGEKSSGAPASARAATEWIRDQWKHAWLEEAFCDLFALFAAGPAYAWANLHLVSKSSQDTYKLDMSSRQEHPSDEARMRMLDAGLAMLGHEREAARIRELWRATEPSHGTPSPEHGRAFPSDLLETVVKAILDALQQSGLRGHSGAAEGGGDAGGISVSAVLNGAWRDFWDKGPGSFREAERAAIARLAAAGNGGGGRARQVEQV